MADRGVTSAWPAARSATLGTLLVVGAYSLWVADGRCNRLFIDRALRSQGRATDLCGRFGGDEFVAILPGAAAEAAQDVAARMAESVRAITFEGKRLSVSIGVASLAPGMNAEELLERADREMFSQKRRRDQAQAPSDSQPVGQTGGA